MTDDSPKPASATRLVYETSAGNLSAQDTYKQFIELMRLCEEDARNLSNLAKQRNDMAQAKGWRIFAESFNQIAGIVTELAQGKSQTSVGYIGHG